jgi:hypothetical protein
MNVANPGTRAPRRDARARPTFATLVFTASLLTASCGGSSDASHDGPSGEDRPADLASETGTVDVASESVGVATDAASQRSPTDDSRSDAADGAGPMDAGSDGDPQCVNACIPGQASCVTGGLATCSLGSNGCWAYGAAVACGPHQICSGNASGVAGAACLCTIAPSCW